MTDEIKRALYAHMAIGGQGRPVMPIPKGFVAGGPCAHCKRLVSPSPGGYTFTAEIDKALVAPSATPADTPPGVVVCSHCATPLFFEKPGEYQLIPRKTLRALPRVTQEFIKREQAIIEALRGMSPQ